MDKEIGGYFHLELARNGGFIHDDGILLNSGRNALEYIVLSKGDIHRLWIPYYTCDTVLEPLVKWNIPYSFYSINEQLELRDTIKLQPNEYVLYTNYFGIKDKYVICLSEQYGDRLIIDSAQALYADAIGEIPIVYSPRKFVGIPDGGIAYADGTMTINTFEQDISYTRCNHLLRRYDEGASSGYIDFRENSKCLSMQPIRGMSMLTRALLENVNFEWVKECRLRNFEYLHKHLNSTNLLDLSSSFSCPMVYPYRVKEAIDTRKRLIDNKVYVATYWPNVFQWCSIEDLEFQLAEQILPLPVDQRYGYPEMDVILETINR